MLTPQPCHAERSEASASMKHTGIIHVFAECDDCTFKTEDHQRGIESAKRHACLPVCVRMRTGRPGHRQAKRRSHRVKIDVGKIEIIDHRKT